MYLSPSIGWLMPMDSIKDLFKIQNKNLVKSKKFIGL